MKTKKIFTKLLIENISILFTLADYIFTVANHFSIVSDVCLCCWCVACLAVVMCNTPYNVFILYIFNTKPHIVCYCIVYIINVMDFIRAQFFCRRWFFFLRLIFGWFSRYVCMYVVNGSGHSCLLSSVQPSSASMAPRHNRRWWYTFIHTYQTTIYFTWKFIRDTTMHNNAVAAIVRSIQCMVTCAFWAT